MKFEHLDVWKRSARLSAEIYKKLTGLKDYGYRDQITRSGLSVPSNIAEGFERGSHNDCIRFLNYARGSCGELRTQIFIGLEIDYLDVSYGQKWLQETKEISAMLSSLIKTKQKFINEDSSLPPGA